MEARIRKLAVWDMADLWDILHEFPDHNFDDSGPGNLLEFTAVMEARLNAEIMTAVDVDGKFSGAMAFLPFSNRSGMLHGLCFQKRLHGTGIPLQCVQEFIAARFSEGYEKISAQIHADNQRAHRFLKKLGAVNEGYMKAHATRDGKPIDLRLVAFFAGKEAA